MSSKQDAEELLNALLPIAKRMLREYGEFYPYGGFLKRDGTIAHLGAADPDSDHPKSKDLVYVLRNSLKEAAKRDGCKAVAIALDVVVTLPSSNERSDAIQICIEHTGGYSVEVFIPYHLVDKNVSYEAKFAQAGKREFFA